MSVESLVNYFKSKPLSGDSIKEAINKYPILYSEYKLELLKNNDLPNKEEEVNPFITDITKFATRRVDHFDPFKNLKKISQLPHDHVAKKYICDRKKLFCHMDDKNQAFFLKTQGMGAGNKKDLKSTFLGNQNSKRQQFVHKRMDS